MLGGYSRGANPAFGQLLSANGGLHPSCSPRAPDCWGMLEMSEDCPELLENLLWVPRCLAPRFYAFGTKCVVFGTGC